MQLRRANDSGAAAAGTPDACFRDQPGRGRRTRRHSEGYLHRNQIKYKHDFRYDNINMPDWLRNRFMRPY